jgi:hypothetical protein
VARRPSQNPALGAAASTPHASTFSSVSVPATAPAPRSLFADLPPPSDQPVKRDLAFTSFSHLLGSSTAASRPALLRAAKEGGQRLPEFLLLLPHLHEWCVWVALT